MEKENDKTNVAKGKDAVDCVSTSDTLLIEDIMQEVAQCFRNRCSKYVITLDFDKMTYILQTHL